MSEEPIDPSLYPTNSCETDCYINSKLYDAYLNVRMQLMSKSTHLQVNISVPDKQVRQYVYELKKHTFFIME